MYLLILKLKPTAGLTFRILPGSILDIATYPFVPPTTLSGFLRRLAMMSAGHEFPNTGPNDDNTPFYALPRELVALGAYHAGLCTRPAHRTYRKGPRDLGHTAFSAIYRGKASGRENIQLHTWEYFLAEELIGYVVSESGDELGRLTSIAGYGSKIGKEGYAFVESVRGPFRLQRTESQAVPSTVVPADELFNKNSTIAADVFTLYSFVWRDAETHKAEPRRKRREATSSPKPYSTSAFDAHPSSIVKYKPFIAALVDQRVSVGLDYLHYDQTFIPTALVKTLQGEINHD